MQLPVTTDETMHARLVGTKTYSLMILKATARLVRPLVDPIIWEHGRRNFALREGGLLNIVCPVGDGTEVCGIGIFVTPDNATLIVAETYAHRLTAFNIAIDGSLSNRRVWAELPGGFPDGICLDAEDAIWCADVPGKRCVRVSEGGGVLQSIELDRGCFACTLGGADGTTLFMLAAHYPPASWGPDAPQTGQVLTTQAPAPRAGWP